MTDKEKIVRFKNQMQTLVKSLHDYEKYIEMDPTNVPLKRQKEAVENEIVKLKKEIKAAGGEV